MTIPILSAIFVVLTSPYPQNPASAIGHVFFLEADAEIPYPLWNAVGFTADASGVGGFTYIKKGVLGGFPAYYEIPQFYKKIEQYSDLENRDLWLYPLRISDDELKRLYDTLAVRADQDFPYRFFTQNCVDGLYSLFNDALDSISKPFPIQTPQNFIELLYKDGRLGEPVHIRSDGTVSPERVKYWIPHRYIRLDIGASLEMLIHPTTVNSGLSFDDVKDNLYFRLNVRPLLHSFYDRSNFYTPYMEFELMTLSANFNMDMFGVDEFWYIRILSISPHESFSWMFNVGGFPKHRMEMGLGRTYEIVGPINAGFLIRNTAAYKRDTFENLSGLRLFTGSFSTGVLRVGTYAEYLYNFMDKTNNYAIKSWICYDILQNISLFGEIKWGGKYNNSINIMTAFYL